MKYDWPASIDCRPPRIAVVSYETVILLREE